MRKVVVRDPRGAAWSVRARRLRRGESCPPWSGPEEDSLRRRLAGVLAAHPLVVVDPRRGTAGGWRMPGDAADFAMAQAWADLYDGRGSGIGADVAHLFRLLGDGVTHLRTPWSDTWRLEAVARGRIRRWAHWEVEGLEATHRAVADVAAALDTGHVPEARGAVLVEVVDQRPPSRTRRSAGLGGHSRVA